MRGERAPRVDLELLPELLRAVHRAIREGAVTACHDVSEGGLVTTLAEMCIGGLLGAEVDVGALCERPDVALFNESAGVFVVALAEGVQAGDWFAAVPHQVLGRTLDEPCLRVMAAGLETMRALGRPGVRLIGMDPTAGRFARFYPPDTTAIPEFFSADRFLRESGGRRAKVVTSVAITWPAALSSSSGITTPGASMLFSKLTASTIGFPT